MWYILKEKKNDIDVNLRFFITQTLALNQDQGPGFSLWRRKPSLIAAIYLNKIENQFAM